MLFFKHNSSNFTAYFLIIIVVLLTLTVGVFVYFKYFPSKVAEGPGTGNLYEDIKIRLNEEVRKK